MREAVYGRCIVLHFLRFLRKVLTRLQNQSNVFVSGAGYVRERDTAGVLKTIRGIPVCQFQEGQAALIRLFFHPIGGKDLIDDFSFSITFFITQFICI